MIFKESDHESQLYQYKTDKGELISESWTKSIGGLLHRRNGPAYIRYYQSGSIFYEQFIINGNYHRLDGPAITQYFLDGSIEYEGFYIAGECIGANRTGFWKFWDRLNKEERSNVTLIKTMMKYI